MLLGCVAICRNKKIRRVAFPTTLSSFAITAVGGYQRFR
jgi:hypothetical protein